MKILCPEHNGLIEITGFDKRNCKNVLIRNMVTECPVCLDEILINGEYDIDPQGIARLSALEKSL